MTSEQEKFVSWYRIKWSVLYMLVVLGAYWAIVWTYVTWTGNLVFMAGSCTYQKSGK